MEHMESIDFEFFKANKKIYLPAVQELLCKTCSKVSLPPYRINNDCFCFFCLKSLKPLIKKQAKNPTIFELLFIDKLKITCKLCDETFNCKLNSIHSCQSKPNLFPKDHSIINSSTLDISFSENNYSVNHLSNLNHKMIFHEPRINDFEEKSLIASTSLMNHLITPRTQSSSMKFSNMVSFTNNPADLKFISVFEKYYAMTRANNFSVFQTQKNDTLIAYSTEIYSIELKNIIKNTIVHSFNGHKNYITSVRHYLIGIVDYMLSSSMDRTVKLWNITTLMCEVTIGNGYKSTFLFSSHVMQVNKLNYIITSVADPEPIKVYGFNGTIYKTVNSGKDKNAFVDSWRDNSNSNVESYIISCNNNDVKLYNFSTGKLYKTYLQKSAENTWHFSCFVAETDLKSFLFESDNKGFLRVWDIHTANLIKYIKTPDCIVGITFWNEQYVLATCKGGIRIIDLKSESVVKTLAGTDNFLYGTIVKFLHSDLGECIMTSCGGGYKENKISLWN